MVSSLLIRIAVNLCLIAVMVIQPMAIVAAQGDCSLSSSAGRQCCQSETVCDGCQCCEVKAESDGCGCCVGPALEADGCCTNQAAKPAQQDPASENDTFSSCMCGIHSEPLAPAPHRVPVPQTRDRVVIAYLDHVGSDAEVSIRPDHLLSHLPIGELSPHFSQRFLCIWRI